MHRISTLVLVTAVGVAATVLATGSPAQASATGNLPLTSWAYLDSHSPKSKFVNQTVPPPIGGSVDSAGAAHTYRSYFTYDLTQLKGTIVHNSYLWTYEDTVVDCTKLTTVEVWRTAPVKDKTTWKNPPAEIERLTSTDYGPNGYGCPGYLGINMVPILNAALSRHEKSITVEYRVVAAQESDPRTGRTYDRPTLSFNANHPPVVTDPRLGSPDRPCGTLAKPSPAAASTVFLSTTADADPGDYLTTLYAIWPVEHPDQRREFYGYSYGVDLSQYADGEVLAWQAQASDYYDAGPWSRTCYVVMDKVAPANPPVVTSKVYVSGIGQSGGVGVPGRFRFDAGGDRDVVAFAWRDSIGYSGQVAARHRGGTATFDFTPKRSGPQSIYVTSIDAVGNRGPEQEFRFFVANTAPYATVTMGGIGLPSQVNLTATKPEVTGFGYLIQGGTETRVAAVGGKATGTVTFTTAEYTNVIVRSYVGDKLIGEGKVEVSVSDAPQVKSAEFSFEHDEIAGATGSFTFGPRNGDVAYYEYRFGADWQRINPAADHTAVLPWTAVAGWQTLVVRSVTAGGAPSQETYYQFRVIDPVPSAYAPQLQTNQRTDAPGLPLTIELSTQLNDVTGYAYRFNGGPEQLVTGDWGVQVTVTPTILGDNTLTFQAIRADGSRSPAGSFTWQPYEGPIVTTDPAAGGVIYRPTTVKLTSVRPDVKEFRYSFELGEEHTVAAGPDGTATVTFTPEAFAYFLVRAVSVDHAGVASPEREAVIPVRDTRVSVWSQYDDWRPRGGIGSDALFTLNTQWLPEVVEYRYRLNGGPEQAIAADPAGSTALSVRMDHIGENTLVVAGRTASGELSPETEYRFLVGTAPKVVSQEYPSDTWAGGVGVQGRFDFTGGPADVASFEWSIGGQSGTVDADEDGHASITWTPTEAGGQQMIVIAHAADGTAGDPTYYYMLVNYA
jgi:hypothetical protein